MIELEPRVAVLLEAACVQANGMEVSGFGFCYIEDGVIKIYDVVALHVGSWGYTEIPKERILELFGREDRDNMRVWWHRHPLGDGIPGEKNWSGLDEKTIQLEPLGGHPDLVKWSVSIVRTPYGWVGRLDNHIDKTTKHLPVVGQAPVEFYQVMSGLKTKIVIPEPKKMTSQYMKIDGRKSAWDGGWDDDTFSDYEYAYNEWERFGRGFDGGMEFSEFCTDMLGIDAPPEEVLEDLGFTNGHKPWYKRLVPW